MNEHSKKLVNDVWEVGDAYESFMGRWSKLVAREFLDWLAVPAGSTWLDVGCGTGILSQSILTFANPVHVKGIDQAAGFISFAANYVHDPRATFQVGTVKPHGLGSDTYDAVVSGLVMNFFPDSDQAVAEMKRITKPGGVIAAYVWDYSDKMELLRYFWDAAVALDSGAELLDEGKRFPICSPEKLRDLFVASGLSNVAVRSIDVQTHFDDFQDYWMPFLSGQGPAPSYVASLSAENQASLREHVRATLPISSGGDIDLLARAWAVRGYV